MKAPRYIGPFKILERHGEVAYQLELPESLLGVHDVFHVSQLKKCLCVLEEHIPLEELIVKEDLIYEEFPVKILETAVLARKHGSRAGWTRSKPERSRDLPCFNVGPVDPMNSQGCVSQFDLQLTRRENLSVI